MKIEPGSVVKTVEGVNFGVPEDWPIQIVGSSVSAIPVEQYLTMKFKNLDMRLQAIEQQVNQLTLRVRVMEGAAKVGLRSGEAVEAAPTPAAP